MIIAWGYFRTTMRMYENLLTKLAKLLVCHQDRAWSGALLVEKNQFRPFLVNCVLQNVQLPTTYILRTTIVFGQLGGAYNIGYAYSPTKRTVKPYALLNQTTRQSLKTSYVLLNHDRFHKLLS